MSLVTDSERIAAHVDAAVDWLPEWSVVAPAATMPQRSVAPKQEGGAAPPSERSSTLNPEQPATLTLGQSTGRERPGRRTAPMHDDNWMAAYREQATPALRQRAERFARYLARIVEYCGGRGDSAYVEDLVHDVYTDTLLGKLSWNPERKIKLARHIFLAIRSRVRHDYEHLATFPHASMDSLDEMQQAEIENALEETTPVAKPEVMRSIIEIVERLRELAAGDREVVALLDGMCAGVLERSALMEATGLSARAYDAARRRLDHLVAQLPQSAA